MKVIDRGRGLVRCLSIAGEESVPKEVRRQQRRHRAPAASDEKISASGIRETKVDKMTRLFRPTQRKAPGFSPVKSKI